MKPHIKKTLFLRLSVEAKQKNRNFKWADVHQRKNLSNI